MYLAYTYLVANKITNQFYYGSRYKNIKLNRSAEDDLWIHYFTSSKTVKQLINDYGPDSFTTSIIYESCIYDACYWKEQELIAENISNPLCMNVHYLNRADGVHIFSTAGRKASDETRKKISIAKLNMSDDTRRKISKTKTGVSTVPCSAETKNKISVSNTGLKRSLEQCSNISKSKLGKLNPNYNKPRSETTKLKSSASQLKNRDAKSVAGKLKWADPVYRQMMMDARRKT